MITKHYEHTELSDYVSNSNDEQLKANLNTEREGQIRRYPICQRRKPVFFVVENFEFSGDGYNAFNLD